MVNLTNLTFRRGWVLLFLTFILLNRPCVANSFFACPVIRIESFGLHWFEPSSFWRSRWTRWSKLWPPEWVLPQALQKYRPRFPHWEHSPWSPSSHLVCTSRRSSTTYCRTFECHPALASPGFSAISLRYRASLQLIETVSRKLSNKCQQTDWGLGIFIYRSDLQIRFELMHNL